MKRFSLFIACGFVLASFSLLNKCSAAGQVSKVVVHSKFPLSVFVLQDGLLHQSIIPNAFLEEIEGVYEDVHVEDLDDDGVGEIVVELAGSQVNTCYRVLRYSTQNKTVSEVDFYGKNLCGYRGKDSKVISAYRQGAMWFEDLYELKDGAAKLISSDSCIGCGAVNRKIFQSNGSITQLVVSDAASYEGRQPLAVKVLVPKAMIYKYPEPLKPTKRYLVKGDEAVIVGFDEKFPKWVEIRYSGAILSEGWMKCRDLKGCGILNPDSAREEAPIQTISPSRE